MMESIGRARLAERIFGCQLCAQAPGGGKHSSYGVVGAVGAGAAAGVLQWQRPGPARRSAPAGVAAGSGQQGSTWGRGVSVVRWARRRMGRGWAGWGEVRQRRRRLVRWEGGWQSGEHAPLWAGLDILGIGAVGWVGVGNCRGTVGWGFAGAWLVLRRQGERRAGTWWHRAAGVVVGMDFFLGGFWIGAGGG